MSSLLVSIRISGAEPDTLNGLLEPRVRELLRHLNLLPDIAVEWYMSQEMPESTPAAPFDSKQRINYRPVSIDVLDERARNCLARQGFVTINQVAWMTQREILRIPNLGEKTLRGIEAALGEHGLSWLPGGTPLSERDWEHLPCEVLVLTGALVRDDCPRWTKPRLELGEYLRYSDEQLAEMLSQGYRDPSISVDSSRVKEHRDFIERVCLLVG